MKICRGCEQAKPESEYNKYKTYKDGLDVLCRMCRNIKERQRRLDDIDYMRERDRKYEASLQNRVHIIIETKKCSSCGVMKSVLDFYKNRRKKDGYQHRCKLCVKEKLKNIDYINIEKKKCSMCKEIKEVSEFPRNKNKRDGHHCYCKVCINKKNKENQENYIDTRRKHDRIYMKTKRHLDENFKLMMNLKNRIYQALTGRVKKCKSIELLGCTISEWWNYLESKFQGGMTRENYGKWEIDHIKPCSLFDLSDLEEQKKCFHYTNTQPLWKEDNIRKLNKF